MDPEYMKQWLLWALHQPVPAHETTRVREAVRLAALRLGLVPPSEQPSGREEIEAPGPINSTALSVAGHHLLLTPFVQVMSAASYGLSSVKTLASVSPLKNKRTNSATRLGADSSNRSVSTQQSDLVTEDRQSIDCLAVPELFYETLRKVHGVLCDDGFSVSFQSQEADPERLLLHHPHLNDNDSAMTNGSVINNDLQQARPRPIEFRRQVILQAAQTIQPALNSARSLMEKLMLEEQQLSKPDLVPTVEVHPIKLMYSVNSGTKDSKGAVTQRGLCLVSRSAPLRDALQAVMRVAQPSKATQCVRLWSRAGYPSKNGHGHKNPYMATAVGDGYELVDFDMLEEEPKKTVLDNANNNDDEDKKLPGLSIGEWVQRHIVDTDAGSSKELEVLIETRKTANSPWPRKYLVLENRIQVGDFVDAQDVTGRWYEAIVGEVGDDTVRVHYSGWASRWDSKLKRRQNAVPVAGVPPKLKAPAPLWTQTDRWRERIQVGDLVEVRDSSSLVNRPKWYKGEVKNVGRPTDKVRDITAGAEVEVYSVNGDASKKEPLLLLGRTQQVLVKVDQEKTEKAGMAPASPAEGNLAAGLNPQPPFLRWVNLFGEEVCKAGTHLKTDSVTGPATLRYEYERNRKPVEIMKGHPMHGSGFMRESLRGLPPAPGSVGLHNLGNSCFLNSTVQCLNHIEPLTQFFLKDRYSDDLNRKNPLGSGGNVAMAFASLLKKMWSGEYSTLVPRLLKRTVANFAPQFDNSYQHDSQEFCQFLMDGLHEDLNRVKSKPYVEELEGFGMEDGKAAIESWRKHLLRHDSIIVDHCQGMHRSHITCPQCGRESIKFDIFSSISLPLDTTKNLSTLNLDDCIDKFMEGEQLDEKNAWYCPSCRKHVCALKMIALWSVPDILILHMKRFTFDTCMTSGNMLRSKIDYKVEFPVEGLDLTKKVLGPVDPDAPPVYKLVGVSEHSGPTANSGHYTATVRNSIDDQWYRCNDSHVGRTSGEAAITGGAYLLVYQRSKGLSKWAGMGKAMEDRGIDPYGGLNTDQEGFTKVKTSKKKKGKS